MRVSSLAMLAWALPLMAMPADVSLDHADEESTPRRSELAHSQAGPGPQFPFGSTQPFHKMNSTQTTCTPNDFFELTQEFVPYIQDCHTLREKIAGSSGLWFISDEGGWRVFRTKIAEYKTCAVWIHPTKKEFFLGDGDVLTAIDKAIEHRGNGVNTKPDCDSERTVNIYVYTNNWPMAPGYGPN